MQTTDKAVAVHYGQDTWSGHDLGYVLEFPQDSLNRGALLQWVSQYAGAQCVIYFCDWHARPGVFDAWCLTSFFLLCFLLSC